MATRVDHANRVLLALLGAALLAAGGLGLARSLNWIGESSTAEGVLPADPVVAGTEDWWFWALVAGVALGTALLSAWWLVSQASRGYLRQLDVDPNGAGGDTWLRAAPIADAVEDEVESYPGVKSATMRLLGKPSRHRHRLVVSLTDRADIDSVRAQLTARTIPNIQRALDFDQPELEIELVLAPRERAALR